MNTPEYQRNQPKQLLRPGSQVGFVDWTMFHREAPEGAAWALATYRNATPYFPVFGGGLETREEAEAGK